MEGLRKDYDAPLLSEDESIRHEATVEKQGERISVARHDLSSFAQAHNLQSLEDRIKRGLDPIGIVAIRETEDKVKTLSEKLDAPHEKVTAMVLDIHSGGPWKYAARLREAKDPATKIWIMLNAANTIGKEREMDMTEGEFLADVDRINNMLEKANVEPDVFFEQARKHVLEESKKRFRIENGVPISELDNGFVAMATNGFESGIIQDADGMLFVGANEIKDDIFFQWGLRPEERKDDRGRNVTFFVNTKGEAVIKKLYPGFIVVLSRNFELAQAIAKASSSVDPEILGQKIYHPTSMSEDSSGKEIKLRGTKRIAGRVVPENLSEKEHIRANFYNRLGFLKFRQIFRDKANALIRKMREKQQGRITNDTLDTTASQVQEKVAQKMDELKYMISLMDEELNNLSPDIKRIVDMAGGAGDLGLAVSMEMFNRELDLQETVVVDPVEDLAVFNRLIVEELPNADQFQKVMVYKTKTLQEAEIPPDSLVVAKHACGDLTDTIFERWVNSESPLLVIMTCCQDKAKDQPARYNIAQEDWSLWCKESSKTNSGDPKKRAQGMEAMTRLDEARVNYLRRFGFDAELVQTNKFPKGDVIIARRVSREKSKV